MNKIRSARLQRKLTLDAAARQLGINLSSLSRIERGQQTPSPKVALRMCHIYDISLDDIYREDCVV